MWIVKLKWVFLFGLSWISQVLSGQDLPEVTGEFLDNLPEETIEILSEQSAIIEDLQFLAEHPLDLNEVTRFDLQMLHILSPTDIDAFLTYLDSFVPIIHPRNKLLYPLGLMQRSRSVK